MALPFRSSAGLMDAYCLRSVPRHSTLSRDLRQLRADELHPEQGEADDDGEDAEELQEVEEVLHTRYERSIAHSKALAAYREGFAFFSSPSLLSLTCRTA